MKIIDYNRLLIYICVIFTNSIIGFLFLQKYVSLQQDYYQLKEQCSEQEQTLEELGNQLSISKLQIADLKEEATRNKVDGQWASDKEVTHCKGCNKEFNITRRRVSIAKNIMEKEVSICRDCKNM